MKYKFVMYDWDEAKFKVIPRVNIVEAIYYAWNYEFDVYERATDEIIFSGQEGNLMNPELLIPLSAI